ncbi:hypothetical protein PSAC2689_220085 [Paraburkholderia sacchari]|uniref:hypothetical protein n=1 Tax=Paraburkholderia sacchari TaxID=159450 RepID=UPI0039A73E53
MKCYPVTTDTTRRWPIVAAAVVTAAEVTEPVICGTFGVSGPERMFVELRVTVGRTGRVAPVRSDHDVAANRAQQKRRCVSG